MNATTHPKRRPVLLAVIGVLAMLGSLFVAAPANAAGTGTITMRFQYEQDHYWDPSVYLGSGAVSRC